MKSKKASRSPVILPNGSASLHVGVITRGDCGAHINSTAAKICGLQGGDYVQIDLDERGTQIVRELCCCHNGREMRDDYVYLDEESFRFLGAKLHETVEMKKSDLCIDCP